MRDYLEKIFGEKISHVDATALMLLQIGSDLVNVRLIHRTTIVALEAIKCHAYFRSKQTNSTSIIKPNKFFPDTPKPAAAREQSVRRCIAE